MSKTATRLADKIICEMFGIEEFSAHSEERKQTLGVGILTTHFDIKCHYKRIRLIGHSKKISKKLTTNHFLGN